MIKMLKKINIILLCVQGYGHTYNKNIVYCIHCIEKNALREDIRGLRQQRRPGNGECTMQVAIAPTEREEQVAYQLPEQRDISIQHFSLQGQLPDGHRLALILANGTLSYLVWDGREVSLALQQQFTNSELSLLLPLLSLYPHYCPYEIMYARFYNGRVTDVEVARVSRHLRKAIERGTWEQEMKPVRNVLSRTRAKLQHFWLHYLLYSGDRLYCAACSWARAGIRNLRRRETRQHRNSLRVSVPVLSCFPSP